METIDYILATEKDLEALADLRVEFALELSGPQQPEVIEALRSASIHYLEKAIPSRTYISCLAKTGDEIAGVGGMVIRQRPGSFKNPDGWEGYLMNMYTRPRHRRKGICMQILDKLITTAKEELGIRNFELHATKEGEPVYIRNGFVQHTEPTYRKQV